MIHIKQLQENFLILVFLTDIYRKKMTSIFTIFHILPILYITSYLNTEKIALTQTTTLFQIQKYIIQFSETLLLFLLLFIIPHKFMKLIPNPFIYF